MAMTPSILYNLLLSDFGNQNWWPIDRKYHKRIRSDPRFEVIVGAILTQNTAWSNVEKALINLKSNNALIARKIEEIDFEKLKEMIQPSGFFNQKAQRLKFFTSYLMDNYKDDLDKFFDRNLQDIREELLSLTGIGPETADSILLYAGDFPIFVVDTYTKRICGRIPIDVTLETYNEIQHYFEKDLRQNFSEEEIIPIFKELHALIVNLAKNYCKKRPDCDNCPLQNHCEFKE